MAYDPDTARREQYDMKPDEAFERDIAQEDRDAVLTMLAEATQGWNDHEEITVLDRDRYDAINAHASLILTWKGTEYYAHITDGNWGGTVIDGWEEAGAKFEYHQPTIYALQPNRELINQAISSGRGSFLIAKWDIIIAREPYASLPGKYAYDRHFAPGEKTNKYWKDKAAEGGFDIVTKEEAEETRKMLFAA